MSGHNRLWYAFYKGWFAGRAGRRRPQVHSMVEHSFMVDGYERGRNTEQGMSNRAASAASEENYDDEEQSAAADEAA